jgi:hypothetical protein
MTVKLLGANDLTADGHGGAEYQILNRFQAEATGTMNEFKVKCNGNGTVTYAVYSDNAGSPSARLAQQTSAQNVVSGWNTMAVSDVSIVEDSYYWLAIYCNSGNVFGYQTSGGTRKYKFGESSFADPFNNTGFSDDSLLVIMAGWSSGIYNDTVTEGADVSDALVMGRSTNPSIAESLSNTVGLLPSRVFGKTTSENTAVSSALSPSRVYGKVIAESLDVADTPALYKIIGDAIAEGLTVTDAIAAIRKLPLSISEAETLTDTVTTLMTMQQLLNESVELNVVGNAGVGASQGPNSPGTMADDASVGAIAWSFPDNAKISDNAYATLYGNAVSHYLKATNYGFSIPAGATINGILVEIERRGESEVAGYVKDYEVKIVKADGTIGSTNKADTVTHYPSTDTYKSYGGIADLWGETWSPTQVNDSDFGVVLSSSLVSGGGPDYGYPYVDHIRITVYYTIGGVGGDPEAQLIAQSSVTEGLNLSSLLIISKVLNELLAEGISVSDTLSVIKKANVSLSEGLTLTDSLLTNMLMVVLQSEGITVTDAQLVNLVLQLTTNESTVLSDDLSIGLKLILSLTEGLSLTDVALSKVLRLVRMILQVCHLTNMKLSVGRMSNMKVTANPYARMTINIGGGG